MIDLKRMLVWDDPHTKYRRWVIQQFDEDRCLAVTANTGMPMTKDEAIKKIKQPVAITYWNHCEIIKTKLSAVVKSAEEITGIPSIKKFGIYIDDYTWMYFPGYSGLRIALEKCSKHTSGYSYDYCGVGCFWLKNWLKDFEEIEI